MKTVYVKKYLVVGIIILFIGAGIASPTQLKTNNNLTNNQLLLKSGKTIYVDDDFNETTPGWNITNFASIYNAKNAASDGDTIFVYNGTYTGFASEKLLTFIGESNENTIINVLWADEKIELRRDFTNFTNFKVTGTNIGMEGELLQAIGNYITISDCNFMSGGAVIGMTVGGEYWYTGDFYNHNVHVLNCSFQESTVGLLLYLSHHSIIENCSFTDDTCGIFIRNLGDKLHVDSYHHIINCDIHDMELGIKIGRHARNYICNCKIYNNSATGILMTDSGAGYSDFNNYITSCLINNNNKGIEIDRGIYYGTDKNCIMGNVISNNRWGVVCWEEGCDGSIIHHNNFVNNSIINAEDANENFWDDGNEGNFWDDYSGVDNNHDGIGDVPYLIPGGGNRQDNYPLMDAVAMEEKSPDKPIIDALLSGYQWVSYNIYALSIDPNYDSLYYFFDWGDGTDSGWVGPFAHGINGTIQHKWIEPGTYNIRVKVKDVTGLESEWSDFYTVDIEPNSRPTIPDTLETPFDGIVGFPVNFSVVSTDEDSEQLRYYFDWGDQDNLWSEYLDSGVICYKVHSWGDWYNKIPVETIFKVQIKAQDIKGADSEWKMMLLSIKNKPPIKPIIIKAPKRVWFPSKVWSIVVTSADPDGHKIAYEVDWGNSCGLTTNIFINSWENYTISAEYNGGQYAVGIYIIKIRAYDYYGAYGEWVEHRIRVTLFPPPKNKAVNFNYLLLKLLERFPLLEKLLYLLK